MSTLIGRLIDFLDHSPTPWHAVANISELLERADFVRLDERSVWTLEAGASYFVVRSDGALVAWRQPSDVVGWTLFGAHTDSPNLRVRPDPVVNKHGYFQLGLEVYGGVLLSTWFDRDLSLAGRVAVANEGSVLSELVDFERAVGVIPNLAIHLNRDANSGRTINPQDELPMILARAEKDAELDFKELLARELDRSPQDIAAFEICAYPTERAQVIGLEQELLASARLDNLLSCFIVVEAIVNNDQAPGAMIVLNDHEEIGSVSTSGADGPFLESILRRATIGADFEQVRANSLMVSIDNAHGVHPNYASKHDEGHRPLLNKGPVVKVNANHRYATTALTQAIIEQAAEKAEVPLQYFSSRADLGCGSTIGPLTAGRLGIDTIDLGCAQFAMHSARETCGVKDPELMLKLLTKLTQRDLI
ncbi:MAG: M18 family aminopeptidase [Pseudomonadota bacterium]|nr:M18 family aminopeptidase [Pseudomonadota bacterium]